MNTNETAINSKEIHLSQSAGNFIYLMIKASRARRILQIGTYGGINTLWLGSAMSYTQGMVVALQCDPSKNEIAKLNFKNANVHKYIQIIDRDLELAIKGFRNPFDLMFIDAPVDDYLNFFQLAFPKIRSGGLIIADRAVSHYEKLEPYLNYITHLKTLENVLVPIGKGLILSYKL